MANNLLISDTARSDALDDVTALINVGGPGTIKMYTGTQPAGPDAPLSGQTLLVTLIFSSVAFSPAITGVATANPITSGLAIAAGTATWARISGGGGTAVFDCTVDITGADINLATNIINVNNTVSIASFIITHPA